MPGLEMKRPGAARVFQFPVFGGVGFATGRLTFFNRSRRTQN
jgi:hypothetical protein